MGEPQAFLDYYHKITIVWSAVPLVKYEPVFHALHYFENQLLPIRALSNYVYLHNNNNKNSNDTSLVLHPNCISTNRSPISHIKWFFFSSLFSAACASTNMCMAIVFRISI